jgi:hypothetical protein
VVWWTVGGRWALVWVVGVVVVQAGGGTMVRSMVFDALRTVGCIIGNFRAIICEIYIATMSHV